MAHKRRNPAEGNRQGVGIQIVSSTDRLDSEAPNRSQVKHAAEKLARRFHLPIATAFAVAELAGYGGAA